MTAARGMWVPGDVTPTNAALSLARAAGFYAGRGGVKGGRPVRRVGVDGYAAAARAVRTRVADAARLLRWEPVPEDARVRLRFGVHGYSRWDCAAAFLAAKWAEDGLVDAGVLRSDRFDTVAVEVTVPRGFEVVATGPGIYVSVEW